MKLKLMPILAGLAILSMAVPAVAQGCTGQKTGRQLTPQQQARMEENRRNTIQQVSAILSPEQRQQFENALASGQKMRSVVSGLNLSQEQQTQVQGIMEASKAEKRQLMNSST